MLGCFFRLTYVFSISSVDLPLYGDFSGVNWEGALSEIPDWATTAPFCSRLRSIDGEYAELALSLNAVCSKVGLINSENYGKRFSLR